jgi:hypothetical protein
MESATKKRLRKKLNKKDSEDVSEESLFTMLNQVNKMLKENPKMVKKVSKCVNSIFENKNLMDSLVNEIKTNVQEEDLESQTLVNNTDEVKSEAVSKESTQ